MVKSVLKEYAKKLGNALAQKLGIKDAPAIPSAKPKIVQAVVNQDARLASDAVTEGRLDPKAVVRVIAGPKQTWIKKL
jgi:hypothetical protein